MCEISEILKIEFEDSETFYVEAVAEDYKLVYAQTLYDPPEYGPAVVYTFINKSDIEDYVGEIGLKIPMEYPLDAVKEYIDEVSSILDWRPKEDDY
jgi:hypothetical protein